MSVKQINMNELRGYEGREGLILQGCGGPLQEWIDGINEMLTEEGILLDGTKFTEDDCVSFKNDDITCLMFEFNENIKLDMGKLAMWRLKTHSAFSGKWLSDFVDHQLGGFHPVEQGRVKPDCALIGADGNIFNITAEDKRQTKLVKATVGKTAVAFCCYLCFLLSSTNTMLRIPCCFSDSPGQFDAPALNS